MATNEVRVKLDEEQFNDIRKEFGEALLLTAAERTIYQKALQDILSVYESVYETGVDTNFFMQYCVDRAKEAMKEAIELIEKEGVNDGADRSA